MSSLLRKYLSDKKELDKRCRSHFSKFSLQHMGYSPLHCATMNGFHLCVIKLLKWGANANLQDEMGCSSLHHAMLKGDIKIIMTLLRHGGNLFLMNKNNATPFDTASMSTKYEILLKLFYFEGKVYHDLFENQNHCIFILGCQFMLCAQMMIWYLPNQAFFPHKETMP